MNRGCVQNIRPWSDAEIERLRDMKARGLKTDYCAWDLGRSYECVAAALKSKRYKGTSTKKTIRTEARLAVIREWWPTDTGVHDIMAMLNELPGEPVLKRNTLAKWADEIGVSRPEGYLPAHQKDGKWTPERDALLREMRPAGKSDEAIMHAVNKLPGETIESSKSVWKRAKKLGVRTLRKNGGGRKPKPVVVKPPPAPKLVKPPPPPKEPKPPRERKPKPAPEPVAVALPPVLAGWHEIARWYMQHSGKRDFAPQLMVVNALRRKMGKAPFQPVAGGIRLRGAA